MKLMMFFLTMFLFSCSKFHGTDQSVWSKGLWIAPWLTALGSAVFFVISYIASRSGSTIQDKTKPPGQQIIKSDINVPIYKIPQFYFGVALAVATIVIILMVNSDK